MDQIIKLDWSEYQLGVQITTTIIKLRFVAATETSFFYELDLFCQGFPLV